MKSALMVALPDAQVFRNEARPQDASTAPVVILNDGDPGDPESTLGVRVWSFQHQTEVEIILQSHDNDTRDAEIDDISTAIATAILADTTIGGTVNYAQASAPTVDHEQADAGAEPHVSALIFVELWYDSASPAG
ncbi:MAG: hypothetical protein ACR2P3_07505 [Geminicoccaceae bacterium]